VQAIEKLEEKKKAEQELVAAQSRMKQLEGQAAR
jgi:hypothetical protein